MSNAGLDKIIQRVDVGAITKPYIDRELAQDESAIWKRLKLTPYLPDELLSRKGIKIYNEMINDEEIDECLNTLKTIRNSSGFEIMAASNSDLDLQKKEFIEFNFENIDGSFRDDLREMMSAVEMGVSLQEMIKTKQKGGRWDGKITVRSIKHKDIKNYNIFTDDFDNIRKHGIVNISSLGYGDSYDEDQFIVYSFQKRYENVFGRSRLRALYDCWFLKQLVKRALGIYINKYGNPHVTASVPPGTDQTAKDDIMTALKMFQLESVMAIPDGIKIDIKESTGKTTGEHIAILDWCNTQIRKCLLGQTLTGQEGKSGSRAMATVHFDILVFYLEELGDDISIKGVNNQIIKRLMTYNFPDETNDLNPNFRYKPLVQEDKIEVIKEYFDGVKNGILKPSKEDYKLVREWLDLPPIPENNIPEVPPPDISKMPINSEEEEKAFDMLKKQLEGLGYEVVTGPGSGYPFSLSEGKSVSVAKFTDKIFTGVRRRTFTDYEKFTDFVDLKDGLTTIGDKYVGKISGLLHDGISDLIDQVGRKKIIEDKNLSAINDLKIKSGIIGDVKTQFENMFDEQIRRAMADARHEIVSRKKDMKFAYDMRHLTPAEVLKIFKQKAFYVTGVERDTIEKKAKQIIYDGIKNGGTLKEITNDMNDLFDPYFQKGELDDDQLTGARLETIVRTNLNDAFNEGRRETFEDPELDGFVEAYQYSAIMDDRVTKWCAEMDGRIYDVNDDLWAELYPPLHFNCRSIVIPVTQVDKYTLTDSDPPQWVYDQADSFKKG